MICLTSNFSLVFNQFVINILNNQIHVLNFNSYTLGCNVQECYNKVCMPFMNFFQEAQNIIEHYNLNYEFINHYSIFFEGIPMIFQICGNCNKAYGYVRMNICFWCKYQWQ